MLRVHRCARVGLALVGASLIGRRDLGFRRRRSRASCLVVYFAYSSSVPTDCSDQLICAFHDRVKDNVHDPRR